MRKTHNMPTIRWTGIPGARRPLDAARDQDKPIFLSIGYSACHWCHVMEHESFENPEIAAVPERASTSTSRSTAKSGPIWTHLYGGGARP